MSFFRLVVEKDSAHETYFKTAEFGSVQNKLLKNTIELTSEKIHINLPKIIKSDNNLAMFYSKEGIIQMDEYACKV